jgi:uncharacterized protein YciI
MVVQMPPHFFAITHPARKDFLINPTEEENKIMSDHFKYLQQLLKEDKLYLAGPTLQEDDPFGIYIFKTKTGEEARRLLEQDPSVQAKIQNITTFRPLRISLHRCEKTE